MPKVARLGHVGVYVHDLDKMTAFYQDILGLTVTDRGDNLGLVFLSSDKEREHHEFALMRGRDVEGGKVIQQISWHVESLEELRAFHRRFKEAGVKIDRVVSHGIALAIYFYDPEGNRNEVYWATGREFPQPYGAPIDLERSAEELLADEAQRVPAQVS